MSELSLHRLVDEQVGKLRIKLSAEWVVPLEEIDDVQHAIDRIRELGELKSMSAEIDVVKATP